MSRKTGCYLVVIVTCALGISLALAPDSYSVVPVERAPAVPCGPDNWLTALGYQLPPAQFEGTGSCAAMACHNADGLKAQAGSEHLTWVRYDPHATAYSVLFSERSKRMVRELRQLDEGVPVKADEDALCLKCHATAGSTLAAACPPGGPLGCPPNLPSLGDGVGCESCHGPAEHYLSAHYQSWWKTLDRHQKANQYGMYPTDDLAFRSMMCSKCHVGDADQEVDHRLIAAGHPALRFEYTSHHHHPEYTRHWGETEYGPDFEIRAWTIGQIAAARSSIELLQARASRTETDWPEFAEYNCFSCHHDLQSPSWRQRDPRRGPLGLPEWNTWYEPTARLAAGQLDVLEPEIGAQSLGSLKRLREAMRFDKASRSEVAELAGMAMCELDRLMAALQREADANSRVRPYSPTQASVVLGEVVGSAKSSAADWDRAAQHYLGIAALYYGLERTAGRRPADPVADAIRATRGPIAFPSGYDSPAGSFTPESFRKRVDRIEELRQLLAPLD